MARREVLSPSQRLRLEGLPVDLDDRLVARHHTLSGEEIALARKRRGPSNRLGFAVLLALIGRRLMGAVEGVARDEGRTLLVFDTRQGEPSEAFYSALGYKRAGVIPNFALGADGTLHATVLFHKEL